MKLTTEVQPGGMVIVRLQGRFDQITAPVVRQRLSLLIEMGYVCLVINMSYVSSLDHDGAIALFLEWQKTQQVEGYLYLTQVSDYVLHVFEEVQINTTPYVHPTLGLVLCFASTADKSVAITTHCSNNSSVTMCSQDLLTAA